MKSGIFASAMLLTLSGVAIAQVATLPETKTADAAGNTADGNRSGAPDNGADPADNASDPGKP